jgi:hypothetical protein
MDNKIELKFLSAIRPFLSRKREQNFFVEWMKHENANDPIHSQCAFDSKEINESDLQNEKHNEGRNSGGQLWCLD